MTIRMRSSVIPLMLAGTSLMSGCGTIHVGNVPFTAAEICSRELAGGADANVGCLPPTRAAHAQSFHFTRFRQQLAADDAAQLRAARDEKTLPEGTKDKSKTANQLPSLIGRVFVAARSADGVVRVPETGNIDFLALGPATAPPANKIGTDVQFVSSFTGVIDKKVNVAAQIDPEAIAETALAGSLARTLSAPVKSVLKNRIASIAYAAAARHIGRGHFMYVSMKATDLDQVTTALSLCQWGVPQAPMRQTSPGQSPPIDVKTAPATNCATALNGRTELGEDVKSLMHSIGYAAREPVPEALGLVTGAAIVVTDGGESEICRKTDIAYSEKGETANMSTPCKDLKDALTPKDGDPVSTQAADVLKDPAVQNSVMIAVSAEYSRAVRKTISIERHASVYALQWVPINVRQDAASPPTPKSAAGN